MKNPVKSDQERLARAGLSVNLFPPISTHSSGLSFCSIGHVHPLLEEFITKMTKTGSLWQFSAQLGISAGSGNLVDYFEKIWAARMSSKCNR